MKILEFLSDKETSGGLEGVGGAVDPAGAGSEKETAVSAESGASAGGKEAAAGGGANNPFEEIMRRNAEKKRRREAIRSEENISVLRSYRIK